MIGYSLQMKNELVDNSFGVTRGADAPRTPIRKINHLGSQIRSKNGTKIFNILNNPREGLVNALALPAPTPYRHV